MAPNTPVDETALRAAIASALPDLAIGGFTLLNDGWDSVAVDIDDSWIFKFPKHAAAAARLRMEAGLLGLLGPRLAMPIPRMVLHERPLVFSQHQKLHGTSLESRDYERLTEARRNALAAVMARFYAELHAVPLAEAEAAGAGPIGAWMDPDEIVAVATPLLPARLVPYLRQTMADYAAIPVEAGERVYGFFDGHGWNMAFDHAAGRLNGVFDFADSGFGEIHKDLSYSNFIAPDLTLRIVARYEALTGRSIDRNRVMLYSAAQRLWELASIGDGADYVADRLRAVEVWADLTGGT